MKIMQKKLAAQSLRFLEAGQLNKAEQVLNSLLHNDPKNADAYQLMAIIELERNNFDAAATLIKSAIELSPNNALYFNTLGNIELHRGKVAQAEQAFIHAVSLDPAKIEYKYNLAHFYLMQNQYQKAINVYYQILHMNPTHYLSIRGITLCYLLSNEAEIALEHATTWVEEFSIYDEPYYYLGLCYYALNNISEALSAYDKGLNLNPNNNEILTAIGVCYHALGNFSIAEIYLLKSLNLEHNNPTAIYNLATIHMDQGDLETAEKLFLNAIALDKKYADPICGLGCLELINGNSAKALSYFKQAQIAEPNNPKAFALEATTLLRDKNFSEGWVKYRNALQVPAILQEIPQWNGEKLDEASGLLIWSSRDNYNLTQQVMLYGLLSRLAKLTKKVTILCDVALVSLMRRSFPDFTIISSLDDLSMEQYFSDITYQAPLDVIGEFLCKDPNNIIIDTPYLKPDSEVSAKYRNKYQKLFPGKKLIGIAWRGTTNTTATDHVKSSKLKLWQPILETDGCKFISLQPDFHPKDTNDIYVDSSAKQSELAEQIASMDIVIGVDNQVTALAAALGKITLTLIPKQSEWYWFNDAEFSTWFRSMRVFKQNRPSDWHAPIKALSQYLNNFLAP